ncbi:MAG: Rho termination factor N-terminal domain-containing protein, partial [Xanthomonadales bacterium]|nr:Rho termination factor N-terminal domain-containing protein [Xanthomonadales bacterium]
MRGGYLGNKGGGGGGGGQRQNRGPRHGRDPNRGPRNGNVGGPLMEDGPFDHAPFIETGEDAEIISAAELAASRKSMNLTTLKSMPINKLVELAATYGVENMARSRKQ